MLHAPSSPRRYLLRFSSSAAPSPSAILLYITDIFESLRLRGRERRFTAGAMAAEDMENGEFYLRYYVGHKGKFGHEFLEFEFRPDGKLRYANNSNYKNDTMIRKEVYLTPAVLRECRRIISDSEVRVFFASPFLGFSFVYFEIMFLCCIASVCFANSFSPLLLKSSMNIAISAFHLHQPTLNLPVDSSAFQYRLLFSFMKSIWQ